MNNAEQQAAAIAQDWRTTPAARPPGYRQCYVEIDRSKGSMYRRVLIHNSQEDKAFHEVVEEANWTRDDDYKLGAHPVPLTTLVEERKAMLKTLIDQDALEIISDSVGYEDSGALASRDAETLSGEQPSAGASR